MQAKIDKFCQSAQKQGLSATEILDESGLKRIAISLLQDVPPPKLPKRVVGAAKRCRSLKKPPLFRVGTHTKS
jgi:hypothetical protein